MKIVNQAMKTPTHTLCALALAAAALSVSGAAQAADGPSIELTNQFNGVTLTALSQEVVDEATSTSGTQADMTIVVARPLDTQNGLYTADMTVIFDAVPRA
ncbi:hypothetical protein OHB41_50210 [Streptomyces sp. NBC_01571]|uniref:hypothetical protein n=1 Tax=Streptomyces sp. NBC_01571 TaxID=2975883 RepID=UPI00225BE5DE|nr:hypothetical protein [Streptomyces sp. NBC_01571]MCX4581140.1 hypothetical protein [Streptomyces sp. NBC_01571]